MATLRAPCREKTPRETQRIAAESSDSLRPWRWRVSCSIAHLALLIEPACERALVSVTGFHGGFNELIN